MTDPTNPTANPTANPAGRVAAEPRRSGFYTRGRAEYWLSPHGTVWRMDGKRVPIQVPGLPASAEYRGAGPVLIDPDRDKEE